MSNIEIKHLFKYHRLPENEVKLLFLILYCPIGLILFIVRTVLIFGLFLLGHVVSDTPVTQKIVNKISTLAFGIFVSIENPKIKENVDVYVSNSLSVFDHLAVANVTGAISPGTRVFLEKMLVLSNYCFGNISNFDTFKKNIYQFLTDKKIPLYFAPEGKATNGKALLKFKSYPFQFAQKVQPVCISLERPFF
ncbi:hypothetical protein NQ318_006244 [Aromia moschata]|uniref:Uncharacterized protein n=1 Tax=Aromia moschata TaxID=1265417 RepID=A0AAV8YXP6_9CUCU|nr:hypothetical protein NQ318_006244 [Aromia moschata]